MARMYKVGTVPVEVELFIDVSKDQIKVLSDVEELALNKKKLPENIVRETSTWKKPNWSAHNSILSGSFIETNDGKVRFDIAKHITVRVKYLLSDWSLKEADPSLKLKLIGIGDGSVNTMLDDASMKSLSEVDQNVIGGFYTRAMKIFYPEEQQEEGKVITPPTRGEA